jgi:tRNA threonylcarbamoyladenosine biosynthesis protein TsaB
MPTILAIDTATAMCSVALFNDSGIIDSEATTIPYTHTTNLTTCINVLLTRCGHALNDLDAVAVSIGPGSYTGLRVGLSAAKGICYGLDKPLIAISTLEALAYGAVESSDVAYDIIIPMIDARRMEVYAAIYSWNMELIAKPFAYILSAEDLQQQIVTYGSIVAVGDGANKITSLEPIADLAILDLHMHATFICNPALIKYHAQDFSDVAYTGPFYLKPPNITAPKRTKL